ncbi:cell morphogenesis protein Las1 [Trypanosoma grayi]|uniref:cell morphogenesis protein Las1 n=1 Tax=Trypanosoma grayi TaxID=71804 RepID=UPI0004F40DB4|nr:cell morphogenesis protein Las1 [Trypanosoma grayi]KEG09923.1 cell morphogenesis protein Las1 [Trypanosoma grayi]
MGGKRGRALQAEVRERRKKGTCIKSGLGELGDLDAAPPPLTRARAEEKPATDEPKCTATKDAGSKATATAAVATVALNEGEDLFSSADFSSPPSTCGTPASVFGHGWGEWRRVKQLLFHSQDGPDATGARRKALDRIELVWQARARKHRPLPAYVESTALLMEAVALDEADRLSASAAVALYGASISRAVHLMTGSFARGADDTYRRRARTIGFPEEAVEVRQRVAHGALPLLSELRWVCGLVLQFLFQHYWVEQEHHVRLLEEEEEEEEEREGEEPPQSATVEEMRQLLDELSDDTNERADMKAPADGGSHVEVVQDGWRLC